MLEEIKALVEELNKYCEAYYSRNESLISDYEYDEKFDRLLTLEKESGIILSNSPTNKVGSEVVSTLKKVQHNHPMLSLGKTKNPNEIIKFIGKNKALAMLKLDGLTISLRYNKGVLVSAETRGNGIVGEDVLHTVRTFTNVPLKINYEEELICDGEAIIDYETFNKINNSLPVQYKNPRNLAAGSVRQLDSKISTERGVKFILWKCIKGYGGNSFMESLNFCSSLGFDVVPYVEVSDVNEAIRELKSIEEIPIDGIVFSYDDIAYGKSLGSTGHHVRSQMAFKFYDEEVETVLKNIEGTMGKTGVLTPTAVFEPVELEGTTVERASLHNVSIMKELELSYGDTITVYKANQIIPQVKDNLDRSLTDICFPPKKCPICGADLEVTKENATEVLMCTNAACEGKLVNRISNFVSKSGMDITGLSKKTIEKLCSVGYVNSFLDIYNLHSKKLLTLEGFGAKKVSNLLSEIEKSKEVNLGNFLCALGIPGLGSSGARKICDKFNGDFWKLSLEISNGFDFSNIEDFGEVINKNIHSYWKAHSEEIHALARLMKWKIDSTVVSDELSDLSVVITGKLELFVNRQELKETILSKRGKVTDSVTSKTTVLINNDASSESSKNKKAKSLGIPILTEKEFTEKYLK